MSGEIAVASAKMDKDLKIATEKIFKSMGLNATTAITMFYTAVLRQNKIPFEIVGDPIYSREFEEKMMKSRKQVAEGRVVVKTLEELEAMEK